MNDEWGSGGVFARWLCGPPAAVRASRLHQQQERAATGPDEATAGAIDTRFLCLAQREPQIHLDVTRWRMRRVMAVSVLVVCLPVAAQVGNVDIQPQRNVRLNGAQFPWGGQAQLGTVAAGAGNRCRVAVEYMLVNQGQATRVAYLNRYLVDGAQVGSRVVAAGSRGSERFPETLDLPAGKHEFQLVLDAENAIAERDEANNRQKITYTCNTEKIDVTAAPALRVAGINAQWNNARPLALRSSQANARRDGYCRFPIDFTIVEVNRRAVTTPFSVVIRENERDGMPAQTIPSIPAAGQARVTGQVFLRCCKRNEPRFAVLHIDPPQNIRLDERDRTNNRFTLNYEITGSCN